MLAIGWRLLLPLDDDSVLGMLTKNPFPGMNPFIEQDVVYHDYHQRFATAAAEMITAQVRPRYIATIDVDLKRETIKDGPEWDPGTPITREYEERLYGYYQRPPYWSPQKRAA